MKILYIIILHWKNIGDTRECIESIFKNNYKDFSIILINNSGNELNDNILNSSKIHIINNKKNVGFAAGCNQGIRKAIHDKTAHIMLLNNDTIIEKNSIEILIAAVKKNKKTIASPCVYKYGTDKIDTCGGKIDYFLGITRLMKNTHAAPDYLSGACIMGTTEAFGHIGCLDENYFAYFEDTDWSLAARKKGYKLLIAYDSIIWHKSSASTKIKDYWGPLKFYLISRNNILFAKKNFLGLKKVMWIFNYLLLGSQLHLILFCRNYVSLKSHYRGIRHGLMNKKDLQTFITG